MRSLLYCYFLILQRYLLLPFDGAPVTLLLLLILPRYFLLPFDGAPVTFLLLFDPPAGPVVTLLGVRVQGF